MGKEHYTFRQANNLDWFFIPLGLDQLFSSLTDEGEDAELHEFFKEYAVSSPEDFVFLIDEDTGEYVPLEN